MKKMYIGMMAAVVVTSLFGQVPAKPVVKNLLEIRNGHFDDPTPFQYWKVDFSEKFYLKPGEGSENHRYVEIVEDGARKHVLKMTVPGMDLGKNLNRPDLPMRNISGVDGIQAIAYPVPINPNKRYRLTVSARASTMNARIYAIGKYFPAKTPPGEQPTPENTRDSFKGVSMNFAGKGGDAQWADVPSQWATQSIEYPPKVMTELAYGFWMKCKFLEVHLIALDGAERSGTIYFDDIRIEELPELVTNVCKIIKDDGKHMEQRALIAKPATPAKAAKPAKK
ncbi:MAG: hypothetical protein FWF84_01580 [Kiritimatiellaeota bacterium]|nr:hypothetical protein [Kiritimatiellota bacterium]